MSGAVREFAECRRGYNTAMGGGDGPSVTTQTENIKHFEQRVTNECTELMLAG